MSRYFSIILLVFCISLGQSLLAQDLEAFKSAFEKSTAHYIQQDSYAFEMVYAFYEDTSKPHPDEKLTGKVIKSGENYYSKIDQTETIYSNGEYVKINHDEKALLYGKTLQNSKPTSPIPLDSMLSLCDNATVVPGDSALIFEISLKKNIGLPYSKMRYELDKKTYAIKKQIIYLEVGQAYPWQVIRTKTAKTPSKIEIILTKSYLDIDQSIFRMSNYIRMGSPIAPSNRLTSYTLYNTTK